MRLYNKIENNNRLEYGRTRKQVGVGENSSDSVMNSKDYFLVVEVKPVIDVELQRYTGTTFSFDGTIDTKTWGVEDYTLDELKVKKKSKLSSDFDAITRPRVPLTLESGMEIEIDGGRTDKDNFKEEHDRMLREGETTGVLKDADNIMHNCTVVDVDTGYKNIVDLYSTLQKQKWQIEVDIDACTTIEELEAITW